MAIQPESKFRESEAGSGYLQIHERVFKPRCIQCHGLDGSKDGGVDLMSYELVKGHISKIEEVVYVTKTMPKGMPPLTEEESNLLREWIRAGLPFETEKVGKKEPEPSPSPTPVPIPDPHRPQPAFEQSFALSELSFSNIYEKIFKPKCLNCHKRPEGVSGQSWSEGISVQFYGDVKESVGKIGMAVLMNQTMPPRGPIPLEDRALLATWIRAGMPETAILGRDILPNYQSIYKNVLQPLCLNCHGSGRLRRNYPLHPYKNLIESSEKMVVPFDPGHSSLLAAIRRDDSERMPPPPPETNLKKLPDSIIAIIQKWIQEGAQEGSEDGTEE